jgi:hypothetical protein
MSWNPVSLMLIDVCYECFDYSTVIELARSSTPASPSLSDHFTSTLATLWVSDPLLPDHTKLLWSLPECDFLACAAVS